MALRSMAKLKDPIKFAKEGLEKRFEKISEETKVRSKRAFVDESDAMKKRLENLAKKIHLDLTDQQRETIEEKLAEIPTVHIQKPPITGIDNEFKLNRQTDGLFQGDIRLTEAQLEVIEKELDKSADPLGRKKRQAEIFTKKWTNNVVYFYFDPLISPKAKALVAAAIEYIQSRTCVNFVESSTAVNRIKVISGSGSYSQLGMVGGEQELSLRDGYHGIGTAVHEMIHALGFLHTQSRSDRDSYITVNPSVIQPNFHYTFVKLQAEQNALYVPYEYGSVMHYYATAYALGNGMSIVPHDTKYAYTIGTELISFYDIQMVNAHYGCSTICPAATSANCKNGGVPNPRNCAKCNCPLGYAGDLCDKKPIDNNCGRILPASDKWQSMEFAVGNASDRNNIRGIYTMCNHWITAPEGKKIQVKITRMENNSCGFGCPFDGIEIKIEANPRMTNPRFCCPEFNNQVLTSNLNPTPVIAFNKYYYSVFTIEYRYEENAVIPTTKKPMRPVCEDSSLSTCSENVPKGYCNTMNVPFRTRKRFCAKSCGLCGKAANPCEDSTSLPCTPTSCAEYGPRLAEFYCAKTCGFCENPI